MLRSRKVGIRGGTCIAGIIAKVAAVSVGHHQKRGCVDAIENCFDWCVFLGFALSGSRQHGVSTARGCRWSFDIRRCSLVGCGMV